MHSQKSIEFRHGRLQLAVVVGPEDTGRRRLGFGIVVGDAINSLAQVVNDSH